MGRPSICLDQLRAGLGWPFSGLSMAILCSVLSICRIRPWVVLAMVRSWSGLAMGWSDNMSAIDWSGFWLAIGWASLATCRMGWAGINMGRT